MQKLIETTLMFRVWLCVAPDLGTGEMCTQYVSGGGGILHVGGGGGRRGGIRREREGEEVNIPPRCGGLRMRMSACLSDSHLCLLTTLKKRKSNFPHI